MFVARGMRKAVEGSTATLSSVNAAAAARAIDDVFGGFVAVVDEVVMEGRRRRKTGRRNKDRGELSQYFKAAP